METQNPYEAPAGNLSAGDGYGEISFFSPSSRIGRLRYLAHGMLVMFGFYAIVGVLMAFFGMSLAGGEGPGGLALILLVPPYIFVLYCSILFMVQRLHDLDKSGWLWLLILIPLVNIGMAIYLIFFRGTEGGNSYGLRPPPNKTWHWILALIFPIIFVVGIVAAIALPAYQQYTERAKAAGYSQGE